MKIKKIFNLILINLVVYTLFIFMLEAFCLFEEYATIKSYEYKLAKPEKLTFKNYLIRVFKSYTNFSYVNKGETRPVSFPEKIEKKLPMATMGCSFTFGAGLNQHETLASQLAKKTQRIVYNAGICGGSPREMLYILRNNELRNELFENRNDFEYVIYPYISDHLFRLHNQTRVFSPSPYFIQNGDSLEFYEPNTYLIKSRFYQKIIGMKYSKINKENSFDLLCLYLKEINKEIKKHFPNAKFIVFIYEDHRNEDWSLVEKEGIKVINFTQLTNIYLYSGKYVQSHKDGHPSALAWEIAIPIIQKELNL